MELDNAHDWPDLVAARRGDGAAFDSLMAPFLPRLALFMRRHAGAALAADVDELDLTQITLLRVHQQLPRYRHRSDAAFYRWVVAIARHAVQERLAYLRSKGRRSAVNACGLAAGLAEPSAADSTPSKHAIRRERAASLRAALDELPADQREVVEARIVDGSTFAEIGERLGVPRSSIFDRFQTGVCRLERALRVRGFDSHS
jgi:RNA polymerase sigma-70 factor, ECF subfamily